MNISSNQNLSFNGTKISAHIPESKGFATRQVKNIVESSKLYREADAKKFDLYFLKPTRKNEFVKIVYYDKEMGAFVRDEKGNILKTSARANGNPDSKQYFKVAERVEKTLYSVVHRILKAPYWYHDATRLLEQYDKICKVNGITP